MTSSRHPRRGEIWTCSLLGAVGEEMGAKIGDNGEPRPERRCVVVSKNAFNADGFLTVVPLWTHPKARPGRFGPRKSWVVHDAVGSSVDWGSTARWAATIRPDSTEARRFFKSKGIPYQYEFHGRTPESWDETRWNASFVDCGQLWTVRYGDSSTDEVHWHGPTAQLTHVARVNVDTALQALLSPWVRLDRECVVYQYGDIVEMRFGSSRMLWLVVSSPAIDYLRENIWAHRQDPERRRPFGFVTVVPLEVLTGPPDISGEATVESIHLGDGSWMRAHCADIRTLDWRERSPRRHPLRPTADEMGRVRRTILDYLGLPSLSVDVSRI